MAGRGLPRVVPENAGAGFPRRLEQIDREIEDELRR
jgi:hypothetical protein